MAAAKKMTHPQDFLNELKQISQEIKADELTPEGRAELLEQFKKIETLLLEMKEEFSKRNLQNSANA